MSQLRPVLAVLVALLLSPLASAAWHGVNTQEPDTAADRASGRMFADADQAPGAPKLYFDAFPSEGGFAEGQPYDGLAFNPNVGAIGTRVAPAGNVQYRALFGIWKDCNKDGYVGMGASALQTYRSELLLDRSVCPTGSPYNDGQWVDEYIAIGMVDPCEYVADDTYRAEHCSSSLYGMTLSPPGAVPAFNPNPRVLYENGTFLWGDYGLPGDAPTLQCALRPLPRGTTASTGGLLADADCRTGYAVTTRFDAADRSVDPSNSLQLYFADPTQPQRSSSRLDQHFPVNLFGDPVTGKAGILQRDSGDPSVTVWDCSRSSPAVVHDPFNGALYDVPVQDPTGGTLSGPKPIPVVGTREIFDGSGTMHLRFTDAHDDIIAAPAAAPRVNDPNGSYWDAADAARDGVQASPLVLDGDCDPTTTSTLHDNDPGVLLESDVDAGSPVKSSSDFTFVFYDGYRGLDPHVDGVLGTGTFPSDLGVAYTRNLYGGPMYSAMSAQPTEPQLLDRSAAKPEGPRYLTFYAMLSPSVISTLGLVLPRMDAALYGVEDCGTSTTGIHNGWQCDPNAWWRDANGKDTRPRFAQGEPLGQVVGAPYFMRDVDCYDGQLVQGALYASLDGPAGGGVCK